MLEILLEVGRNVFIIIKFTKSYAMWDNFQTLDVTIKATLKKPSVLTPFQQRIPSDSSICQSWTYVTLFKEKRYF